MRKQFVLIGILAIGIGLLLNYAVLHPHANVITDPHVFGGILIVAGAVSTVIGGFTRPSQKAL